MELSCKVEYALIALLELACHPNQNEPLQVKHIASRQGIPNRYLEHIFITLRRGGIVRGLRGSNGGYLLARQPQHITLLEIFDCLERREDFKSTSAATLNRSVVRETWKEVQKNTVAVLEQLTLQDLHQQRTLREQFNGMYFI